MNNSRTENIGLGIWVSLGFIAVMASKGAATFFHQYLGDMFGIQICLSAKKRAVCEIAASFF